jgi:hypothetical protein
MDADVSPEHIKSKLVLKKSITAWFIRFPKDIKDFSEWVIFEGVFKTGKPERPKSGHSITGIRFKKEGRRRTDSG